MSAEPRSDGLLRVALVVLAIILIVPMAMMIVAVPMMGSVGGWWGDHMGFGASPIWGIGMALVWLVVLAGLGYLLLRGLSGGERDDDPALRELRMAYARGDLSDDEFEERRETLRRGE